MRKSRILDALFPKTRQVVLAATLLDPTREWYQSDLARHLRLTPSSLQREQASLVEAGILRRRNDGNRVYYSAETESPVFDDLHGLLIRTAGLKDVLTEILGHFRDAIDVAFVYGSLAREAEHAGSDIDLMVVGSVGLSDIAAALRKGEERLGRPINPSVYRPEEIVEKLAMGHHFLKAVMNEAKLFVLGNQDDLANALERKKRPKAQDEQAGA